MLSFLDHIIDQAREQEIFSREDVPTEERVWAAFLHHSGLSYRNVGLDLDHSREAIHPWCHQIAKLFDPEPDRHGVMAVDETKVNIEDEEVYVWAAVDVNTFEIVHVEVTLGRSDLDASVFLKTVLSRCRGEPVILADRGPWYDWPLNDLDLPCRSRRETWENARSSRPGSSPSSTEPCCFSTAFRTAARGNPPTAGRNHSQPFTMRSANVDTLAQGRV